MIRQSLVLVMFIVAFLSGCGGSSQTGTTLHSISVVLSTPPSLTIAPSGTAMAVATVLNDNAKGGVTWSCAALQESASSGCSRPITRNLNQSCAVQLPSKLKPEFLRLRNKPVSLQRQGYRRSPTRKSCARFKASAARDEHRRSLLPPRARRRKPRAVTVVGYSISPSRGRQSGP